MAFFVSSSRHNIKAIKQNFIFIYTTHDINQFFKDISNNVIQFYFIFVRKYAQSVLMRCNRYRSTH